MKTALPFWKKCPRWTEVEAQAALLAVESSGMTIAAFAEREGLVAERLYSWRRRLSDAATAPSTSTPQFVEIPATPARIVEVVFPDGVVLRVAEGIDPGVLRGLADAVGCRGC